MPSEKIRIQVLLRDDAIKELDRLCARDRRSRSAMAAELIAYAMTCDPYKKDQPAKGGRSFEDLSPEAQQTLLDMVQKLGL